MVKSINWYKILNKLHLDVKKQHPMNIYLKNACLRCIIFSGQTAIPPIINRKVAAAMVALSVYGLLLIVISNNNININPVYVLTNIRNRYYIYNDASTPVTDGTPEPHRSV